MKKIIDWIFNIPFLLFFGAILVIFHPLQVIALKLFGYKGHKITVDWMCFWLVQNMRWTMSSITLENLSGELPTDRPIIIASNHQSSLDIPMIAWLLKRHHPKYVSKDSLAHGIPSISYNIRNGGSVTIDRKKPAEAVEKIRKFGEYLAQHNRAACIFPEGTRAKDGQMKPFKSKGLLQLLDAMPNALVVPVAITENWRLEQHNFMPASSFNRLRCTALPALEPQEYEPEALVKEIELSIRKSLGQ